MENDFLKMMSKEDILRIFDEMMVFVKSDSPTAIDYLCEIRNRYDAQPEIVRCKNCRFYEYWGNSIPQRGRCSRYSNLHHDNWFCADGVKR